MRRGSLESGSARDGCRAGRVYGGRPMRGSLVSIPGGKWAFARRGRDGQRPCSDPRIKRARANSTHCYASPRGPGSSSQSMPQRQRWPPIDVVPSWHVPIVFVRFMLRGDHMSPTNWSRGKTKFRSFPSRRAVCICERCGGREATVGADWNEHYEVCERERQKRLKESGGWWRRGGRG